MTNKYMFHPVKIGSCEIPNRFAVTAILTGYCNFDGTVTERFIKYHETRAKGGFGLIITEDYRICPGAANSPTAAGLWCREQIEGNKRLTEAVHKHGAKIFCQIYHAGRQTNHWITGEQPICCSPIACPSFKETPKELSVDEIHELVRLFGVSASYAKEAGFDGIEIHAGNGYLAAAFMSVYQNKRTDEYGGCFNNRMRFMREIYESVREAVGEDFPIMVRFSAEEHVPSGRMIMESRMVAREMESWGVDAINCSNGVYSAYIPLQTATHFQDHAWALRNARELKSFLKIPVLGSNGVDDPLMADTLIQDGWCDIVGMARTSLADPFMPSKARDGRYDEIRPCIRCMGCIGELMSGHVHCCVNPETGREVDYSYDEEVPKKNVLIIGGGPAGLEAAEAAARRGHKVTLWEKSGKLGGQFLAACYPPTKGDYITYLCALINDINKLGVRVVLNKEADAESVIAFNADKVILATGALPNSSDVPGADGPKVFFAEDILLGRKEVMGRILVVGSGETAAETALFMAAGERGCITMAARTDRILKKMDGNCAVSMRELLRKYEVKVITDTRLVEVLPNGAVLESEGVLKEHKFDAIVLGIGYHSNNSLAEELRSLGDKLVVVGDACEVKNALAAAAQGYDAGYKA